MKGQRKSKKARAALRLTIVRTVDALMQVFVVRGQTYIAEQDCPYREEFDGNDLAGATHLLAYVGDEPAAAMRIRWFAGFAKFERICVRAKFRGAEAGEALVAFGYKLAARKGYAKVLVHANQALVAHWQRVAGMQPRLSRPRFRFSDIEFVEMERDLAADPAALSIDSPALVLVRPEGAWDRAGVLERSSPALARSRGR